MDMDMDMALYIVDPMEAMDIPVIVMDMDIKAVMDIPIIEDMAAAMESVERGMLMPMLMLMPRLTLLPLLKLMRLLMLMPLPLLMLIGPMVRDMLGKN